MTIRYGYFNSFRLRQLTGIPITRLCEVACEIAYDALLQNPDLLHEARRKYVVRTPERQLEIDVKRGYKRVIPLECIGLGDSDSESPLAFQEIFPSEEGVWERWWSEH